jgi:hypothetical protein
MGKPVGVLVRNADELAAVRVGNPFLAAPGKFTVAIFLDEQPSACQHLAHRVISVRCGIWSLSGQSGHRPSRANQARFMNTP